MTAPRPRRILVVTDHSEVSEDVTSVLRGIAASGPTQFRLVVLNPARAEVHLLHPERHDKAAEAETALARTLPAIEQVTGARVIGSVSVRHDPMDAIEETLAAEPVDEIVLALPEHHVSTWLHQDLAHRLARWDLPVHTVTPAPGFNPSRA